MMFVLPFAASNACQTEFAGGKGAMLARLSAQGLPVPSGLIITTAAYDAWVAPHRAALGNETQQADAIAALTEHPLPLALRVQLAAQLEGLVAPYGFAVRSSATTEDSAEAAFAGIYDSHLGAASLQRVLQDIRAVYLSYWSARALAYRQRQNIAHLAGAMAVVIQPLILPDAAGVAFTADPITGQLDRILITANFGLGDSVVAGEGETDRFVVDKKNGAILSRDIGQKTQFSVLTKGAVALAAAPHATSDVACLNDRQIGAIADLARKLERQLRSPQDIEWAVKEDRVFLLQARPITALPPRWTRDESAERFPEPITPLTWDFVDAGFDAALAHSFALMGLPRLTEKWFAKFDHYIYGNQTAVDIYLGPLAHEIAADAAPGDIMAAFAKRFSWLRDFPATWHQSLDSYLMRLGALANTDLAGRPALELWQHAKQVAALGSDYFKANLAISFGQAGLYKLLAGICRRVLGEDRGPHCLNAILATAQTRTGAINGEIRRLAQIVKVDPLLRRKLQAMPTRQFCAEDGLRDFAEFAATFSAFLASHGHRETNFDPYHPTWSEAPWIVLDFIKLAADAEPVASSHNIPQRAAAEKDLFAVIPEPLQPMLRELIELALTYTELDDLEHYQTSRLSPVMRRALLALGEALRRQRIVAEASDVFFARAAELDEALAPTNDLALAALTQTITTRKRDYHKANGRLPTWVLGAQDATLPTADALCGVPCSPGTIEGDAVVVRALSELSSFPKGAILVAQTTTPAWTPFLFTAGGVVCESGGPLSHGAVIAREMRVPAVMAVRGALATLRTGDRIRVDGTNGTVSRVATSG